MTEISFTLSTEFIELYKLLKVTGLCETGGAAKQAIARGEVRIDGHVEMRKACKVRKGQRVECSGHAIRVL